MKLLFSKCLSRTDETQKLSIPCKKLKSFPCFKDEKTTDWKAKDIMNGNWHAFRISIRRKGPYYKPVLSMATWHAYVQAKSLKAGNLVSFFVDQRDETIYVQACNHDKDEACRKKIKLFGEVMHVCTECMSSFFDASPRSNKERKVVQKEANWDSIQYSSPNK